jgi:hypothetical protein
MWAVPDDRQQYDAVEKILIHGLSATITSSSRCFMRIASSNAGDLAVAQPWTKSVLGPDCVKTRLRIPKPRLTVTDTKAAISEHFSYSASRLTSAQRRPSVPPWNSTARTSRPHGHRQWLDAAMFSRRMRLTTLSAISVATLGKRFIRTGVALTPKKTLATISASRRLARQGRPGRLIA